MGGGAVGMATAGMSTPDALDGRLEKKKSQAAMQPEQSGGVWVVPLCRELWPSLPYHR